MNRPEAQKLATLERANMQAIMDVYDALRRSSIKMTSCAPFMHISTQINTGRLQVDLQLCDLCVLCGSYIPHIATTE